MGNDLEFLMFFTFFVAFIVFITGLWGTSIISHEGFESPDLTPTDSWVDIVLLPITVINSFFSLFFFEATAPIVGAIFGFVIVPYLIGLAYLVIKLIRGTG